MDQKAHWDKIYSTRDTKQTTSSFVEEVSSLLKPNSKVLELGCGEGHDAAILAKSATVVALDHSEKAIELAKEKFSNENLVFKVFDISKPLKLADNSFDLVYARLSLHYFDDETTRRVFAEIHRVLKSDGKLAFLVKSTNDPLYGKGTKLEEDMYELNGHIRHFFGKEYTISLLKNMFEILELEEGREEFYGKKSAFIKSIVKRLE